MIGEVFFLRAFYYFELCKRYGGVPLVTKSLTLNDDIDLPRNSFDETVAQIVKDCDSAFNRLPVTYIGTNYENYYGRATKWAAAALKARILLYAASTLNNPNSDRAKWVKALEAAKPFLMVQLPLACPMALPTMKDCSVAIPLPIPRSSGVGWKAMPATWKQKIIR